MRKFWYGKGHRYIASLETCWRKWGDLHLGAEVTDNGDSSDFRTTIELHLLFLSIWFSFQMPVYRRRPRKDGSNDYNSYAWGLQFYQMMEPKEEVFVWNWGQNIDSWSSSDPWWRHTYINIRDLFFGHWSSEQTELSRTTSETWTDPMDGKTYPCHIKVTRYDQKRRKIRAIHRRFHRIEIDLDPEAKGVGAPIPGKGENSWDCGDTHTSSLSEGLGNDPLPADPVAHIKAVFTKSVQRTRERYGGTQWRPQAA